MIKKLLSLIICIVLILVVLLPTSLATYMPQSSQPIRGVIVKSENNRDFPSKPNLTSRELKAEINNIVDYIDVGGYNTIMFQIRSKGESLYNSKSFPKSQFFLEKQGGITFFDPLKQMIATANKENLNVYAVINPFYLGSSLEGLHKNAVPIKNADLCFTVGNKIYLSPFIEQAVEMNVKDISNIISKYDIEGIILEGLDDYSLTFQENYNTAINSFVDRLKTQNPNTKFGITLSDYEKGSSLISKFDLVLPKINGNVTFANNTYQENLSNWLTVATNNLIPVAGLTSIKSPTVGTDFISDPNQIVYQQFTNKQSGIDSVVIDGFTSLKYSMWNMDSMISSLNDSKLTIESLGFNPEQSLKVTHPKNGYKTNLEKFFVSGTSDKSVPLTLNGEPVEVKSENGTFGVLVTLKTGTNTLSFKQGDKIQTITIEKYIPTGTSQTISKITATSPTNFKLAYGDKEFTLRCTAPSGSAVSATLNGKTYQLTQNSSASDSVAAVFSTKVILQTSPDDFKNIGNVTYTLNYKGNVTTYKSNGNVYLIGENSKPAMRVTDNVGSVYFTDELIDGTYKSIYKKGTVEDIILDNEYSIKLASGGYIKKTVIELVDRNKITPISVNSIEVMEDSQQAIFTLKGGAGIPFELEQSEEGIFTVNLLGKYNLDSIPSTPLFSDIKADYSDTISKIILTPSDEIWGYDIFYNGVDAEVFFKKAPQKSDNPFKPLKNMVVVLDPGHGGNDPGAPGTLKAVGPHESAINLNVATNIKKRLEELGATVYMTRDDDTTISLTERAIFTTSKLPHVSISTHHNSLAESSDSAKVSGVEGYYYYGISKDLSDTIIESLTETTGRKYRTSKQANYIVSKYNYTKAMLFEIGYLPNPAEYERVIDPVEVYKTAQAVSSGLVKMVN